MKAIVRKSITYAVVAFSLIAILLFAMRVYVAQRGAPLEPWHRYVPHELSIAELNNTDWDGYLKAEATLFATVRTRMAQQLKRRNRFRSTAILKAVLSIQGDSPRTGIAPLCLSRKDDLSVRSYFCMG